MVARLRIRLHWSRSHTDVIENVLRRGHYRCLPGTHQAMHALGRDAANGARYRHYRTAQLRGPACRSQRSTARGGLDDHGALT